MIRKMMLAAVAMLVLPVMASAQTVTATATVTQYAEVAGDVTLAFGALSATVDNVIDATDGSVTTTVSYNHDVDVEFTGVPSVLTGTGGTLAITLMCATQEGATWSTAVACDGASLPLDVGSALTTATLGFGGTILAADVANAPAGDYSGTFDITVTAR
jgi:hypothetical protein